MEEKLTIPNPFVHEAATNIDANLLYKLFIDNDKSKSITNQKNVFIKGYRGSGKSMLMRYNSFPVQVVHNEEKNFDLIGIYVSCSTPYFRREDIWLNDEDYIIEITSEHFLVLTIAQHLIETFIPFETTIFTPEDLAKVANEYTFYFDRNISPEAPFTDIERIIKKDLIDVQNHLNHRPKENLDSIYTYASLIIPLIDILKSIPLLSDSHFSFLIDDGQNLNKPQQMSLNGWISYRNLSNVSFKVAITSTDEYIFHTPQNKVILKGHDFITLDLQNEQFSGRSDFVDFAKNVIEKRLEISGLGKTKASDFFPTSTSFEDELSQIRDNFIKGIYPERKDWNIEQRSQWASKYTRAIYFRLNHEKAKTNFPRLAYTGLNVLINTSTGVVRNLLTPCFSMYEAEEIKQGKKPSSIRPSTQYEVLEKESASTWAEIDELDVQITDCTAEDTTDLRNALGNFGIYLRSKLIDPASSEKRILTFTIRDLEKSPHSDEIKRVLDIAVQGGIIYTRMGSDHEGGRTKWYTPKRILWIDRGLDPVGQNGRKNFPAKEFYQMMKNPKYMIEKLKLNEADLIDSSAQTELNL